MGFPLASNGQGLPSTVSCRSSVPVTLLRLVVSLIAGSVLLSTNLPLSMQIVATTQTLHSLYLVLHDPSVYDAILSLTEKLAARR